jgi:hydrogenase maturation protease
MTPRGGTVVIGVGNEYRRDDGAGPAVVELLRGRLSREVRLLVTEGDPVRLIEAWSPASLAVVVDAVRADPPQPGRLHRFTLGNPSPGLGHMGQGASSPTASTHGFGLGDAVGLALALDRMPDRLVVLAIEAADLTQGIGMTPAVAAAVGVAATTIRMEILAQPADLRSP